MALLQVNYDSHALGKMATANLIVPQGVPGPYAVMFLLHGLSDDHSAWCRRTSIERYVEGLPLIVVMPDGGRGFYADAAEGYAFGTALGIELPALIRQWFPTRLRWAVTGLSMGGYGAVRFGLAYPETFVSAVSHSGALHFGRGHRGEDPKYVREFGRILGENPAGGPCDLYALAASGPRPALRIDCGTEDWLLPANRQFHEYLDSLGYEHEYEEYPGDHNWEYWDEHVQEAIAFHRRVLGF
jgi:S-formylglutathione hydrolase FrmB